ncbi:MAG: hypothetical protein EAZ91_06020 [Cytophagales bacterium]|nr:MAG: hypothetical protein EAZ91_06020 [Cytophagales bacterium]
MLVVSATVADLTSTYYASPDLSRESNWFVVTFKLGWIGMILVTFTLTLLSIALYLYHRLIFKIDEKKGAFETPAKFLRLYFFRDSHYNLNRFYNNPARGLRSFIEGILNFVGYYSIRLAVLFKTFFVLTNTLNSVITRHYEVTFNTSGFIMIAKNSSWTKTWIESFFIWWVCNEQTIDFTYLPIIEVLLTLLCIPLVVQFEKKRMVQNEPVRFLQQQTEVMN